MTPDLTLEEVIHRMIRFCRKDISFKEEKIMSDLTQVILNLEIAKLQFEYALIGYQIDAGQISIEQAQKEQYPILMKIDFGVDLKQLIEKILEET